MELVKRAVMAPKWRMRNSFPLRPKGRSMGRSKLPGNESLVFFGGQRLNQIDDPAPHLWILNADESPVQLDTLAGMEEIDDIVRRGLLGHAGRRAASFLPGRAFEEERHGRIEDRGDRLEPACADPVGALFVFLDLLKRDA